MLNPNLEQKLSRSINEIRNSIVVSKELLKDIYISYDVDLNDLNTLPTNVKWEKMNNPYSFTVKHTYCWIKTSFDLPKDVANRQQFVSFDPCLGFCGSTIRPQGLLYLNGKPVQGIDVNHIEVLLTEGHYDVLMLFYTHDLLEKITLESSIIVKDTRAYRAYWDLFVPFQSLTLLDQKDDNYFKMLPVLERACNIIDFRNIGSEAYFESLSAMSDYMDKDFYHGICGGDLTVNVIGHSHIDVAWLWDYAQTREKTKRTFSSVLKLMDEYPEYNFLASTPQIYQFIKEDLPEVYEQIKEKHKEGRWEIEGSLMLECDCNLTGAESMVRQIVYGKRFIKDEFGVDSKMVWLPDVFGYSGAMPQIMAKAGVDHFITAKIGWNDTNRFPYDTFIWRGIDGSEVNAYLISTSDLCDPRHHLYDITYTTYCADVKASHILGTWHRYSQKDLNQTTFMTMGFGDGGGGVTREMLEAQRRFSYGIPGIPKTKISTIKETIDEIHNNFTKSCQELRRTPTWTGELYFEFHRGTLTSVPMVKKYNRDSENLLLSSETVSIITKKLLTQEYPKELYDKHWRVVLLNQFHDVLPGSSIEKVYNDAYEMYTELFNEVKPVYNNNISLLAKEVKGEGVLVYNPNSFVASGYIVIDGKTYVVKDIPSFGYKVCDLGEVSNNLIIKDKYLENQFYRISFANDGSITSLFDKRFNRELVEKGKNINKLVSYEDMAFEYDNWELAPFHKQKPYVLDEDATFKPIIDNQKVGFEIVKKYGESVITQRIFVFDNFERIDIECDIDWKEKYQFLKALFPLNLHFDEVKYEVQFGHIARKSRSNNSFDAACFESVGHKWIDASENNYGFAILNDGKYGFGAEDNEISISLIKCASFPNENANKVVPTFTYSLLPHDNDLTRSDVIKQSYVLNRPLVGVSINNDEGKLPETYSFVKCLTDGVFVETIKEAFDDERIILRLYEANNETKIVRLNFANEINEASILDLLENVVENLTIIDKHSIEFNIKPFEIITLGIK